MSFSIGEDSEPYVTYKVGADSVTKKLGSELHMSASMMGESNTSANRVLFVLMQGTQFVKSQFTWYGNMSDDVCDIGWLKASRPNYSIVRLTAIKDIHLQDADGEYLLQAGKYKDFDPIKSFAMVIYV